MKVTDISSFKQKALKWANNYDVLCYLDSNNFNDQYGKFDVLIAAGAKTELTAYTGTAFEQLSKFRYENHGFMFGFFGYDLKYETEKLPSINADRLNFPDLYFFVPEIIITIKGKNVEITGGPDNLADTIQNTPLSSTKKSAPSISLKQRFSKEEYIDTVEKIKTHISRGDIYVTNFCQEFFSENAVMDPLLVYLHLHESSPTPFSSFFKWAGNYIICASPERFLAKRDGKLISQPIKGTARRDGNQKTDQLIINELRNHPKELQENVMIVDLVRNDLTHSAKAGTVKAEELFGIHSFNQVHQMVSTVVCEMRNDISCIDAIKNTFPMGSMTGAPKINAMRLMEQYERTKRGAYSGALGYFSPDGDFDFNVIIRSILYNTDRKYLSFQVGSAITYHADAAKEYEECLLKAKAILEVLGQVANYPLS
ncbi:anthranilate synthase component I family protein [Mucilaginibacter sp. SD-g]|uniref:Anthranilate synthase component I family protein n=1 Tax=Mucilaginibacter segetis TaxID=2793071 RepID=A0A934PRV0_9SPHI|nr:anthranilate synthase component I family protein [Mucilaginibacter segetis]